MEAEFSAVHSKPVNLKDPSNLIALSIEVSENYSLKPTLEKYTMLYDIKEVTGRKYRAMNAINIIDLEEEIRGALSTLISLTTSKNLPEIGYDTLRIDEKISDILLQNKVQNHVLSFY